MVTRDEMFPAKHTRASDVLAYNRAGVVVTVEHVTFETMPSPRPGEAAILFLCKFRELKKHVRLSSKTLADGLFEQLGSDTEDWPGQVVRLVPVKIEVNDRSTGKRQEVWTLRCDKEPPNSPPVLPANTDLCPTARRMSSRPLPGSEAAGGGAQRPALPAAAPDLRPIGQANRDKAGSAMAKLGGSFDAWLRWLKLEHPEVLPLAFGVDYNDIPRACLPALNEYIASLAKSKTAPAPAPGADAPAAPAEPPLVIDRTTGEVISPKPPDEDDIVIPF